LSADAVDLPPFGLLETSSEALSDCVTKFAPCQLNQSRQLPDIRPAWSHFSAGASGLRYHLEHPK
jgi:hypothetical protein